MTMAGAIAADWFVPWAIVVVMLAVAPTAYVIVRKRRRRLLIVLVVWTLMLAGVMFIPVVNTGGYRECSYGGNQPGSCRDVTDYGAIGYAYFCLGAKISVTDGDVGGSLGSYTPFAACLFA